MLICLEIFRYAFVRLSCRNAAHNDYVLSQSPGDLSTKGILFNAP